MNTAKYVLQSDFPEGYMIENNCSIKIAQHLLCASCFIQKCKCSHLMVFNFSTEYSIEEEINHSKYS